MNQLLCRKKITFLFITAIIGLIAAINIKGVHHADEHYQILEFAHIKLNNLTGDYLTWEYEKQIRSWLHPAIFVVLFNGFKSIGIESPFIWVTMLRIASIFTFFFGMYLLWKNLHNTIQHKVIKTFFFFMSFLFWFYPYFGTRTSSETLSTCLFVFAYYHFMNLKRTAWRDVLIGVLFGLSFLVRYHLAIMVFFLCLWALVYKKKRIMELFTITIACVSIIALGSVVDFWGYGDWQFTLWKFYYENIATGYAASVSSAPWWRYIYEAQKEMISPIGIIVVISFFYFWYKKPKSEITWITLSFFVFQSLVAHKEFRYIFPMCVFIPYVWSTFLDQLSFKNEKVIHVYIFIVCLINFLALLIVTFRPAHYGVDFYKYLYKADITKIYYLSDESRPDWIINSEMRFYKIDHINFVSINSYQQIEDKSYYLHTHSGKRYLSLLDRSDCRELYPNISDYQKVLYYGLKLHKKDIYSVFKCGSSL